MGMRALVGDGSVLELRGDTGNAQDCTRRRYTGCDMNFFPNSKKKISSAKMFCYLDLALFCRFFHSSLSSEGWPNRKPHGHRKQAVLTSTSARALSLCRKSPSAWLIAPCRWTWEHEQLYLVTVP